VCFCELGRCIYGAMGSQWGFIGLRGLCKSAVEELEGAGEG
jgi:hypothetical protein